MARILVVDDEADLRKLVRKVLERAGHGVTEASNGQDACRLLFPWGGFDIVITDLVMPVLGGLEVIRMVRELAPGTRIIAMSGCGWLDRDANGLALAAEYGADLCLPKPFSPCLLLDRTEQLLLARPA